MERLKNATLVDVARAANVSVATVSRVVNGNYPVSKKTRDIVEAAIKDLRYVPNLQARELNTSRSSMIGVIVPSLYNMFFSEVIDGIEDCARKAGASILVSAAKNDAEKELERARDLVSRNVMGMIIVSPNMEAAQEDFYISLAERIPLVFINSYRKFSGASFVRADAQKAILWAMKRLWELGHRKIFFVRGENSESYQIKEEAYIAYLGSKGMRIPPSWFVNVGDGNRVETVERTAEKLEKILLKARPSALLCCNDLMAVGAIHAAVRLGLEVPRDLSIVGYDNTSLSRFITPKLTTLDQRMFRLGSEAAGLVLRGAMGERAEEIVLENILIERETMADVPRVPKMRA